MTSTKNKHSKKSTLVARGAATQPGSSCVFAPLATNVDLWNPSIQQKHAKNLITASSVGLVIVTPH